VSGSTAVAAAEMAERRQGVGRRRRDRVNVRRGKKEAVVVEAEEERKRPRVSMSPAAAVVGDGRRAAGIREVLGFRGAGVVGLLVMRLLDDCAQNFASNPIVSRLYYDLCKEKT
jgi:hypothetical protein